MPNYRQSVNENLGLALDTLRTHKFRSFLTILGVLIGTTTVIAVASIIAGLNAQLVGVAEQYGTNTLWIYKIELGTPHRLTREERLRKPLTFDDGVAIKDQCSAVQDVSMVIFDQFGPGGVPPSNVRYKGHVMDDAQFMGATSNHLQIANVALAEGRFFTDTDNTHRRDVVVIAADVVQRLFQHVDPIGKAIMVDGHEYTVIGTTEKFKGFLGNNPDDLDVFVPYLTYKKDHPMAKDNFLNVLAKPGQVDRAIDQVTWLLRLRRHVKPSEPNNFGIDTAASLVSEFHAITGTVALVMVVISSIGLLVGGIGVMNIMLVSVTERTREIGVRKAIGARRSDITWQFLFEAMTLTGIGGVVGIIVGWMVSLVIHVFAPGLPSTVPLWSVAAGFLVATGVGLFFGLWPALKASRLDPIVALRYE